MSCLDYIVNRTDYRRVNTLKLQHGRAFLARDMAGTTVSHVLLHLCCAVKYDGTHVDKVIKRSLFMPSQNACSSLTPIISVRSQKWSYFVSHLR